MMAKIAKYQRRELDRVLDNINRAIDFVEQDRIAICTRDTFASTTLHYTRDSDDSILYEINKLHGSKLVSLWEAKRQLDTFLAKE